MLIDQLYDLCADGNSCFVDGEEYSGGDLLAVFLQKALTMLGVTDPERQVDGMMITVPFLTKPFVRGDPDGL